MRTLQEKYNAIQEGKFSKEHFLAEARMQQPQLITRFNGYDDAVQILKNRGMIQEANLGHNEISSIHQEGGSWIVTYRKDGTKEKVFKTEKEARDFEKTLSEARRKGVVKEASYKVSKNSKQAQHLKKGDIITSGDEIISVSAGAKTPAGKVEVTLKTKNGSTKTSTWGKTTMIGVKPVNEAKLTKKSLTDYRYKPTNEMDKYPYEQILRGLRVELEVAGVLGTPTAEEYAKALAKVSKNLAKDSIFYTNQLAGVNPKVDLHDKMVDATVKNTVDTFNGMKKIKDLKEDHSKNPNDKYVVRPCKNKKEPWAVWEGEKRVKGFATKEEAKEYADKQNKKQGLTESVLKEGIKNLIKKALQEGSSKVEEKIAEIIRAFEKRFGEISESTREEFREAILEDYEENTKGILKMSMQDAVEIFDSSGLELMEDEEDSEDIYEMQGPKSDGEYKSELADYLEDNQIYGYTDRIHDIMTGSDEDEAYRELAEYLDSEGIYGYTRAIERIYSDYPYDQHWMNQEDEDESKELPKEIPGFEGTRDELDDLFESKSLKDLL